MTLKYSFSNIEKNLLHEFRERISKSEDKVDLLNVFSKTTNAFLLEVFKGKIKIKDTDCIFDPKDEKYFRFSEQVMSEKYFLETLNNSDIKNVIKRFADTTKHRYIHLQNNPKNQILK